MHFQDISLHSNAQIPPLNLLQKQFEDGVDNSFVLQLSKSITEMPGNEHIRGILKILREF